MDQWRPTTNDFSQSVATSSSTPCLQNSTSEQPRQRPEMEVKDPVVARKVQKADREKLRRDRLNELFLELGCAVDPDRPKNDKATILTDTIQILKDLAAEVDRLKSEYAALSDESRELTLEKNELREEKTSLKSEIENLNVQYQQRCTVMLPCAAVDPSVIMAPSYSYPVPVPVPPAPIPMHPSLQPFPFFGNQNAGVIPASCSTFVPYPIPASHQNELPSTQYASSSHVSSKQDSKSKSTNHEREDYMGRSDDSGDVVTDLELKMPGSTEQVRLTGERKGKQPQNEDRFLRNGSSSSRISSSQHLCDSSSTSVGDVPKFGK
uniref:Uncharacterized protein MANES_01G145900 n=1 Tax=Rhizophora mucronata TaxID=61149 RepID=A0A2P2NXX9_RHIMU